MSNIRKTISSALKRIPWGMLAAGGLSLAGSLIASAVEEKRTSKALEQMVKDEVKKLTTKKD